MGEYQLRATEDSQGAVRVDSFPIRHDAPRERPLRPVAEDPAQLRTTRALERIAESPLIRHPVYTIALGLITAAIVVGVASVVLMAALAGITRLAL